MAYDDVRSEFDYQRKKAASAENANLQAKRDALARRQAQLGGGPGGAFIKMEQQAQDESAKRLADANEGIDTAQRAEMRRIREIDEGRKFQTSEREASQTFARGERIGSQEWQSGQAQTQRDWQTGEREASQGFATSERLGSQEFAAGQAETQRDWQTGEREASQTFAAEQQQKEIDARFALQKEQIEAAAKEGKLNRDQAQKQLDELIRQYEIDTANNKTTNTINTILSAFNSGLKPEQINGLLKELGIDIAGIPGITESLAPSTPPSSTGTGVGQTSPETGKRILYYTYDIGGKMKPVYG